MVGTALFSKSLYALRTVMEETIFGCIQGVLTSDSQPKEGVLSSQGLGS